MAVVGMLAMSGASLFAQNSATATGTSNGTVILPIGIRVTHDLNFGTFTSPQTGPGTVILDASSLASISSANAPAPIQGTDLTASGGGIAIVISPDNSPNSGEPLQFGTWEVTGQAGFSFTVTVPSQIAIVPVLTWNNVGPDQMTLTAFTTNLPSNTGTIGGSGFKYLAVGATLNVNQYQRTGNYTGYYQITAAY